MSKALIAGINQVATDKGLDREVIFEAIEAALISAYKRNYGSVANVTSEVDRVTGDMRVFAEREVVEDVMNWRTEISLEEATQDAGGRRVGRRDQRRDTTRRFRTHRCTDRQAGDSPAHPRGRTRHGLRKLRPPRR